MREKVQKIIELINDAKEEVSRAGKDELLAAEKLLYYETASIDELLVKIEIRLSEMGSN